MKRKTHDFILRRKQMLSSYFFARKYCETNDWEDSDAITLLMSQIATSKVNNTKSTDRGVIYILKGYLRHYTRKIKNLLMHKKNMCGKIKNKTGRVNETHVRIESDTTYRT